MATLFVPTPGVVYKFKFQPGYEALDGTYKLGKLMTYDEYLADKRSMLVDFFRPNGKTEEDLNKVQDVIRASKIMKLSEPSALDEPKTVYAPVIFLKETPDHNVKKYIRFGMITYVGVTEDPTTLDFVKDNVTEQFEAALGITPDAKFVSVGEQWLTDTEYQEELQRRDQLKKRIINYYSENRRLEKEISQTNTKLQEYEKVIISLQKQVDDLTQGKEGNR